jgi:hypothetical protein
MVALMAVIVCRGVVVMTKDSLHMLQQNVEVLMQPDKMQHYKIAC